MNGFQNSCFVSYRHGDPDDRDDLLNSFAAQVKDLLAEELRAFNKPVFFDEERIKGGFVLNPILGSAICKSVCSVVIFVRDYLSKQNPYCAAELMAMLNCESDRLTKLGIQPELAQHRQIITIILRDPDLLPDELGKRKFYDFSKFSLQRKPLRDYEDYSSKFKEMARFIRDWYDTMEDEEAALCQHCDQISLPDLTDQIAVTSVLDFIQQNRKKSKLFTPTKLPQS